VGRLRKRSNGSGLCQKDWATEVPGDWQRERKGDRGSDQALRSGNGKDPPRSQPTKSPARVLENNPKKEPGTTLAGLSGRVKKVIKKTPTVSPGVGSRSPPRTPTLGNGGRREGEKEEKKTACRH